MKANESILVTAAEPGPVRAGCLRRVGSRGQVALSMGFSLPPCFKVAQTLIYGESRLIRPTSHE
jgi:hypothetical protein